MTCFLGVIDLKSHQTYTTNIHLYYNDTVLFLELYTRSYIRVNTDQVKRHLLINNTYVPSENNYISIIISKDQNCCKHCVLIACLIGFDL